METSEPFIITAARPDREARRAAQEGLSRGDGEGKKGPASLSDAGPLSVDRLRGAVLLGGHDVHELVLDDDDLADRHAFSEALHVGVGERGGLDLGLGGFGGHEDFAAKLTVDLNDEFELVGLERLFADFGPRRVDQIADALDVAELLPERRRDVRSNRVERAQQDRGAFAERRQIGGRLAP